MNTSESWEADSYGDSNFFQTVISASEGDVLVFIATDGEKVNTTKYRITEEDNKRSGLFSLNLTLGKPPSGSVPDLTAVNISTDSEEPVRGDVLNITATIENRENITANTTSVVFLDEKNISIQRNISKSTLNDTVSQPGALKIRVHFSYINIHGAGSYIKIYNASDVLIYNFTTTDSLNITNFWTNWGTGAQIRIESHAADYINFTIDKYESVFANKPLTLGPWQSKGIKAEWNASAWLNNDTDLASGNHIICVSVDPLDLVKESDETNNNMSMTVEVKSAVNKDLEVVNITLNKTTIFDGDIVNISATVKNKGTEDVSEFNVSFIDFLEDSNTSEELDEAIVSNLSAGDSITINASWEATLGNHTITAIADPYDKVRESNEKDNQKSKSVYVRAPYDFSITHISLSADPDNLFSDELVTINATLKIMNFVNRSGTVDVCLYLNETLLNTRNVEFNAGNATINESFEWRAGTAGNHALTVCVDPNNKLTESNESNNNMSVPITVQKGNDFAVTNLMFKPQNPVIGDIVKINATIANFDVENKSTVAELEFYDNKAIKIERTWDEHAGETTDDVLMLPDARKIRVHFSRIRVYSHIIICDKNGSVIEEFDSSFWEEHPDKDITDYWTKWCYGDTIRIESQSAEFTVDRYEALLANVSFSLDAENRTNHSAVLNLSMQEMGWALNGTHNITAMVDPYDEIDEPDEENNINTTRITVTPSLDFAVTNVSFKPQEPLFDDIVRINATVKNFGVGNGTTSVEIYYDNRSKGQEVLITNKTVRLNANKSKIINASWPTGVTSGGAGPHNITVRIDPHDVFTETNETNNTLTRQIFVNGTDLAVTNIDIPCENLFIGLNVNITATIANLGAIDAHNFSVNFSYGFGKGNTSGVVFNTTNISSLTAGNSTNVTVSWKPPGRGFYTINVSVTFVPLVDNDETNNMKSKNTPYPLFPGWDFSIENVSVYPEKVQEGENVTIVATVGNPGLVSENVSVGFFVNYTDFAAGDERFERIGTVDNVFVSVNKTTNISFNWTANVHGGDHLIVAVVDPDDEFDEQGGDTFTPPGSPPDSIIFRGNDSGNNVKSCTLHIYPPDLTISNLSINPSVPNVGDAVNITVEIKNNESTMANSTVWFYVKRDISVHDKTGFTRSLRRPENAKMRVHFDFINITFKEGKGVVIAYNENKEPVCFYVTEGEGANAQAVKVFNISADKISGNISATPGYHRPYWNVTCELICDRTVIPYKCSWNWIWTIVHDINSSVDLLCWQNIWTDWCTNKKLEINAIGVDYRASSCRPSSIPGVEFLIDEYQFLLGKKTVMLKPGESRLCNLSWNASFPLEAKAAGKNYTFMAFVEGKPVEKKAYLGGTDLAVTNISAEPAEIMETDINVLDGNLVRLNATIKNFGSMNASKFNVSFYEVEPRPPYTTLCHAHYKWLGNKTVEGLPAGSSTNISISWNASIRDILFDCWGMYAPHKWKSKCNDYTIEVKIDPLENHEEDYENNNLPQRVYVKPSRDFFISNLSFTVNNETIRPDSYGKVWLDLYDNVTLNATLDIINYANQGGTVNVSFYLDEIDKKHEIGRTSVSFGPGYGNGTIYEETRYAILQKPWKVEVKDIGDHNITVVVNPEPDDRRWKIYEINETNNTYTQPFHVRAPDLVVEHLDVNPETFKRGENALINVTIANRGEVNATDFNLTIYDCAERHIEDVSSDEMYCGFPAIPIKREDATAMRLYLDLEIEGGKVCVYDSKGTEIECYYDNFHGWTPWIVDNCSVVNTTKNGTHYAYAKVSRIYYIERSGDIYTETIPKLDINETVNFSIKWTPLAGGERFISAIADPENNILEYDEMNNIHTYAKSISVQTADLIISSLSLRWVNGTSIVENGTIKHGDNVTIVANVRNRGVKNATESFNVSFFVDDVPIKNEVIPGLAKGTPILLKANWSAIVGEHVIKVEADYGDRIDETNKTNNIEAKEIYVCGAEVTGNTSWETLGLHGEILFLDEPEQPYDEDTVNITVNITNIGCLNATDFNVLLFYDYSPDYWENYPGHSSGGWVWVNKTYPGANLVYLRIIDRANKSAEEWDPMDPGDVEVYDAWGNAVLNQTNFDDRCKWAEVLDYKECWIPVRGNTASMRVKAELDETFIVYFYPIIQNETSWIYESVNVPVNSSVNLTPPMQTRVRAGDFKVTAVIDPENKVPEDDKTDNIITRIMYVNATRDFTVFNVTADKTNLSDTDTTNITAEVANLGLRNGTANVSITDYETETRTYNYHFNKSLKWSYLPVPPNVNKSLLPVVENAKVPPWNLTVIHRPGADSIQLHFDWISLPKGDYLAAMLIQNETGDNVFGKTGVFLKKDYNITVPGDTVYIYNNSLATFSLSGYTTRKEFLHKENVQLNASELPEDITMKWFATTGNHSINVTVGNEAIKEINESNNSFVLHLNVNASRDPMIENITFNPPHPADGDNVTISAIVKNNGTESATFMVDLWLNLTRNSSIAPVPDADWAIHHKKENRTSYIIHLKRENVTLGPDRNGSVNAVWRNISILGDATYKVIAIVDPLDWIDEINNSKSDNDMRKEIKMDYPDLTVTKFISPSREDGNASVVIANTGVKNASNVTVRFEVSEYGEKEVTGSKTDMQYIKKEGAKNIRVHFKWLDASDKGRFEIRKNKTDEVPVKEYYDEEFMGWSPWVPGDSFWLVYSLSGKKSFKIDAMEWGEIIEENINGTINASESAKICIPPRWGDAKNYTQPRRLKVIVDPYNNITELREDNNSKTGTIYIDLMLVEYKKKVGREEEEEKIHFVSPAEDKLCVLVEQNKISAKLKNNNETEGIVLPANDFYVKLEVRHPNGTLAFDNTTHYQDFKPIYKTLYAGEEEEITFDIHDRIYPDFNSDTKNYKVVVIADSEDDIIEANDFYCGGEDNNNISRTVKVHSGSEYMGGDLHKGPHGKVYGDIIYSKGDTAKGTVNFNDMKRKIPKNANITLARLYYYWYCWNCFYSPSRGMMFGGVRVSGSPIEYFEDVKATKNSARYGVFVYDVTDEAKDAFIRGRDIKAVADQGDNMTKGMLLLVVYEKDEPDENEPLIEYWIDEGAERMMADNQAGEEMEYATGFQPEQCTANASLDGVVNITKVSKAELFTALAFNSVYKPDELVFDNEGDALLFNGRSVGSVRKDTSHWDYEGVNSVALTWPHWVDVTTYLESHDNLAQIQSKGNCIMATNAVLKVTYLPDLTVSLYTPPSSYGGATHKIEATISNIGEAKAENFEVRFTASDGMPKVYKEHIALLEGLENNNNTKTVNFTWTAPDKLGTLEQIKQQDVTIRVTVDPAGSVGELNESNNEDAKNVVVTITEKPFKLSPGGGGSGPGTGPGESSEAVTEAGATAADSGEATIGATGGETITGRLMKGIVVEGGGAAEGGGGERGEFSWVGLLIRIAMLAATILLVYIGYLMERRRQNNK